MIRLKILPVLFLGFFIVNAYANKLAVLYTTDGCLYCELEKNYLVQLNVPFKEIKNDKRYTTYPVLKINGQVIIGYNPPAIKRASND